MSEPKRAPVDFFIKMYGALVAKNYSTALDYCNTILRFEKTNETMIKFHKLLENINMMDDESDSTSSSFSGSSLSESDNDLI